MAKKAEALKKSKASRKSQSKIVIDENREWVFESEKEVIHFFSKLIDLLQDDYSENAPEKDFDLSQFPHPEAHLEETLKDPTEVWEDRKTDSQVPVHIFIREWTAQDTDLSKYYYVVMTYLNEGRPTFIFTHFPTREESFVDRYRRGHQVFSKEESVEIVDALSSQDEFAVRLHDAMLRLRNRRDIPSEEFQDYDECRMPTLDEPDEVWRSEQLGGRPICYFIKEFSGGDEGAIYYVVVTAEESASKSNYVLFSFPTKDRKLVERVRQGERMKVEEFVREESH